MAMNKKEKATLEAALTLAAFHMTAEVLKDVEPPGIGDGIGALSTGYTFNAHSVRINEACSSSVSHGTGGHDKTTSQQPIRLFSTRKLAIMAMRRAVERRCCEDLRRIDRMIESEESNNEG